MLPIGQHHFRVTFKIIRLSDITMITVQFKMRFFVQKLKKFQLHDSALSGPCAIAELDQFQVISF